ncbi:protein FAM167B-like isoform X2 [Babylonia areolata]|uniref:protein FAM167B-like isoform X2 n=1 Tax=Babylonia areolata TaxID=304850 RepID=UPI003FD4875F
MRREQELRQCVSLTADRRGELEDSAVASASRAAVTPNGHGHGTTLLQHGNPAAFCPVSIQIEGCSDEETDSTGNTGRQEERTLSTTGIKHKRVTSPSCAVRHSPNVLEVPENSDLSTVKATALRLHLRTRTSSFLEWQAKWLDRPCPPPELLPVPAEVDGCVGRLTNERRDRINEALAWLRTELEMQCVDQHLARQLLSLRHDIHQLRLSRSCQQHQDLLDDVQSEMEEQEELPDVLDLPSAASLSDTPLRHLGVTRMNIYARRFSTC